MRYFIEWNAYGSGWGCKGRWRYCTFRWSITVQTPKVNFNTVYPHFCASYHESLYEQDFSQVSRSLFLDPVVIYWCNSSRRLWFSGCAGLHHDSLISLKKFIPGRMPSKSVPFWDMPERTVLFVSCRSLWYLPSDRWRALLILPWWISIVSLFPARASEIMPFEGLSAIWMTVPPSFMSGMPERIRWWCFVQVKMSL